MILRSRGMVRQGTMDEKKCLRTEVLRGYRSAFFLGDSRKSTNDILQEMGLQVLTPENLKPQVRVKLYTLRVEWRGLLYRYHNTTSSYVIKVG